MEHSDRVSTVGKALEDNLILSVDHPTYRHFADEVEAELTKISERESLRRATAQPLLFTSSLDADQLAEIGAVYPEFALKVVPLNRVNHSYWTASRLCANEWLSVNTAKYATSVVHYGGSLVASLAQRRRNVHLEYDPIDEAMVNEAHAAVVDTHRMYSDFVNMQAEYGVVLPRLAYDEYLTARAYSVCSRPFSCSHEAEALCVDLSVTAMSPEQVALAMIQHKATLCHGFFIYQPSMLVQKAGELGSTGVSFRKGPGSITFQYPEGRSGVNSYPTQMWARWLASHTFAMGALAGRKWFQLELMHNRECFMFFRMVEVPQPSGEVSITHALDLGGAESQVLVKSWRLKEGFASDPADVASWEPHNFLVSERLERRVREFAMQLAPTQFNRFAIKKQIRVVNNRWVVHGTTVTTSPILNPQDIEDLTTAIFSKAFVDRYESSQLASDMMRALQQLSGFHSMSSSQRWIAVSRAAHDYYVTSFTGRVTSRVKSWLDSITQWLSPSFSARVNIQVVPAPTYLTLTSAAAGWKQAFSLYGEKFYLDREAFPVDLPLPETGMAGSVARIVQRYSAGHGRKRSVVGAFQRSTSVKGKKLAEGDLVDVVRVCTDVIDTRASTAGSGDGASTFVETVSGLNPVSRTVQARHEMKFEQALREAQEIRGVFKSADDPDPVHSLNSLYVDTLPEVARVALEFDTFSLSLDPQDRTLAAPYLRMPSYFGLPPRPREYYRSKLTALNVPKRQNTSQELLTAVAARNLSAPAISQPQEPAIVTVIWENFLSQACVADAREKLLAYQADPVALEEGALKDWVNQAKPGVADRVIQELRDQARALEQMKVSEYVAMLKADVKPTLSVKPVSEVTAPQVIVYHEKALSALYSSMFRVLVRRFLSLLKPNYHVNLLKNTDDIQKFITANHPFMETCLKYLENDFSKYDKSQSQFAFDLEYYVFQQLGLNQEFLDRWLEGHTDCSIRSLATGLSLHVMYQRKSGDATTAFGNVILNVLSVSYAYAGTHVVWAVFMGDDSEVCAKTVNGNSQAVQTMAEVFNLTSKFYITDAPYFASHFIDIDEVRMQAIMRPDPIKRIERLSMHVAAEDPQWRERHTSFKDAMVSYSDVSSIQRLAVLVPQRYQVSEGFVRGGAHAFGTLVGDFAKFRSLWEDTPQVLQA